MDTKRFAYISGVVMLALGIVALFVPGSPAGLPYLDVDTNYGAFLGMFPMNILNKLALVGFGIAGIAVARAKLSGVPSAVQYSRWLFYVMGALAVLGMIPQTNTLRGTWPLFGGDIILHVIFSAAGAYYGYASSVRSSDPTNLTTGRRHAHGI